jgi:hypothetical protein
MPGRLCRPRALPRIERERVELRSAFGTQRAELEGLPRVELRSAFGTQGVELAGLPRVEPCSESDAQGVEFEGMSVPCVRSDPRW